MDRSQLFDPTKREKIINPLCERSTLNDLRRRHVFAFSKGLGQNFLVNPRIPYQIVQASEIDESFGVLEIGPGIGALTYELAKAAKKVVAIEIDRSLEPILAETLPFPNVEVMFADFMNIDVGALIEEKFPNMKVAVVANLPYYITTPIVMKLLETRDIRVDVITVMVQTEVAERLCAPPGSDDSGAVSLAVEYYSEPKIMFKVPSGNFMPMPKVDSAVIRMKIRNEAPVMCNDVKLMFELIKLAYGQRRKTLVNAVGNSGKYSKRLIGDVLESMKLSREIRGERMTLSQFAILADALMGHENTSIV